MESFQNPHQKLNPDLVQSVQQNQSCNPGRLFHFFLWSAKKIGTFQNLKSFLILSKYLCNANQFKDGRLVIDKMIRIHKPISSNFVDASTSVELTSVLLTQLIDVYKVKCMLDEAVGLLLSYTNDDCFQDLVCLNSLMGDLLKNDKLDLCRKVYERLVEANVTLNVKIYNTVIDAYCRSGKMEDAKRVILEMEEKNCSPNKVTYNLLIGGLCGDGRVNEAIEYKKSMNGKGLISDKHTYNSLFDGFMRDGKIEEVLSLNYEMVAMNRKGRSTLWCFNNVMTNLLKLNKMGEFMRI